MAYEQHYMYRQRSGQGCLSVCLAYLCGIEPSFGYEHYMVGAGVFMDRDSFVLGMIKAFQARYFGSVGPLHLAFARPSYVRMLQSANRDPAFTILPSNITKYLAGPHIRTPFVLYVDRRAFGSYYHYPHFVLVVNASPKTFTIFDPWDGACRRHSRAKVIRAAQMLEVHLRICPVIISRPDEQK